MTGPDGDRWWVEDGFFHREGGPAVERRDGRKEWWTRGEPTRAEHGGESVDIHAEGVRILLASRKKRPGPRGMDGGVE